MHGAADTDTDTDTVHVNEHGNPLLDSINS